MGGRRLVLVRHGRTAWNAEGRAQGHADVSLDDTGRDQAEAMATVVAGYDPVLLVSSDLARARETAASLEKETGLSAEEDPRLREYDVGIRAGLTREEYVAQTGDDRPWEAHLHLEVAGAETPADVAERIVPAVREVLERLEDGQTAVLVVHGAALRIAVAGVLGWPLEAQDSLEGMRNCHWAVLCETGSGRLRLSTYNQTVGGPDPD